ncbi:Mg-chelatase subunit ChlD [Deinococcus metalli]|uniref:Mg-chelatase subunit ChlD n=1 Tax=Deinococcus metalli TaxID=1141878 RepID=A0A7W8KM39_9DEIO|nr:VWA domain-containing protein [Deinococcus metalli]MBB5379109.1 Mg-chelatase subunit ChlD [Deinococcus metalli]GHF64387.1 VWA domain-containing protein [Deinococcus metalli]
MSATEAERLRRWRLVLGGGDADGLCGGPGEGGQIGLTIEDRRMDDALSGLYDAQSGSRRGGLGASAPKVARWLADLREFFPQGVVRVMQQDAIERLNLQQLLFEPEMLEGMEPDVNLVGTLLSLKSVMPDKAKDAARAVVRRVVDDLTRRLEEPTRAAVTGSLNRAQRNFRPRPAEIDWNRTIRANLKTYQPDRNTIIPERLIGMGRRRRSLRDIVLCLDQSGSMASSVVYAGIFGAVLASLPAVSTRVVVFDTEVVDLSEHLDDPVDVLYGIQLGGGTDINRALAYCQGVIPRPEQTIFVLISDLYEGGNEREMLARARTLKDSGVNVIALLALSDDGAPSYDHGVARAFAGMGIPAFACTPDHFPGLMAAAIRGDDVSTWAGEQGLVLRGGAAG